MLYDTSIKPKEGDLPRKWISDDYFDLIIWYQPDQRVYGFQLCYDKEGQERAVTWIRGKGIKHNRVDTGDALPTENRSPILVAGGVFPANLVKDEFLRRSIHLPPAIRRLVLSKLEEFGPKTALPYLPILISIVMATCLVVVWKSPRQGKQSS